MRSSATSDDEPERVSRPGDESARVEETRGGSRQASSGARGRGGEQRGEPAQADSDGRQGGPES